MVLATGSVVFQLSVPSQSNVGVTHYKCIGIAGMLLKVDSPRMVNLATFATAIFVSSVWSPGKNTIVVLILFSFLCILTECSAVS